MSKLTDCLLAGLLAALPCIASGGTDALTMRVDNLSVPREPVHAIGPYAATASAQDRSAGRQALATLLAEYVRLRSQTLPESQLVAAAQAGQETAAIQRGPGFSFSAGRSLTQNDNAQRMPRAPSHGQEMSVDLKYAVLDPLRSSEVRIAATRAALSSAELDQALEKEALQLFNAVLQLAASNEQHRALGKHAQAQLQNLDMVNSAMRAGLLAPAAQAEVELSLARIRRDESDLEHGKKLLVEELELLLQRRMNPYRDIDLGFLGGEDARVQANACAAAGTAVAVAEQRLELAQQARQRVDAQAWPTVEAGASLRRRYSDLGNPQDKNTNAAELSVRLAWNFGHGLQAGRLQYFTATNVSLARDGLTEETRRARGLCDALRSKIAQAQANIASAAEQQQLAQKLVLHRRSRHRVDGFRSTSIEQLISAQTMLYEADMEHLKARQKLIGLQWEDARASHKLGVKDATFFMD